MSARDRVAVALATVFGAGYAPVAPGTAGSAVTALALWLVPLSRPGLVLVLAAVVILGTWAAHHAERVIGGKDPGAIVVDEVAGMILSVIAFPLTPAVIAVGFLLFRVFDVVKPPPAQQSQRIKGGVGVMVDDLIAGAYALGVLAVSRALLGMP
ncbi:MAG: phosphatidylglycerophosphatase A [Candidatus Rokubacteria bacterium]|nr:phosphatidylglycerophosphatase A [Candidatus Rokubacteria bacterium]